MKNSIMVLAVVCMLGWMALPRLQASEFDKKTFVTFHQSMEIPGMVLPPGEYVMKRADRSLPDVVRFTNANENHTYATVFAIPTYRSVPTDKVVILTEERRADSPEAIKKWFYPGDSVGAEFVYPKSRETLLAMNTTTETFPRPTTLPAPAAPAVTQSSAPVSNEEAQTQSEPQRASEVEMAQSTLPPAPASSTAQTSQPAPAQQPAPAAPEELPKTASDLPMLGLVGLLCILGGLSLRKWSRRVA